MTAFPLPLAELLGHWGSYVVYFIIGIAFGMSLESAGFGNSRLLAAQFYFKDMRVFKVMFTAIIVAMTLVFLTSALGWMDYNLMWVPPTYLWPGILGGLIMGFGFIFGGFCPGTSLVAMATGKIDGIVFVLGVVFGIFVFGETVQSYEAFWNSSFMGRFTLPDLFGVSYGTVVLAIVVIAVFMFWLTQKVEAAMGGETAQPAPRWALPAAGVLVALAATTAVLGQPTVEDRWKMIEPEAQAQLDSRAVYISPAELLATMENVKLKTELLDVRDERDYNLFHIEDARQVPPDQVVDEAQGLIALPGNTVTVVMSNDEAAATEAWKKLRAESVPNVYILEGGVNNWIRTFADQDFVRDRLIPKHPLDRLAYRFDYATGARHPAAEPNPHAFDLKFEPKIKLELKRAPVSGGCG